MHDEPELIDNLRTEGAHGYLLKNANPEEVRKAIEIVVRQQKNTPNSVIRN
jgi:DNA-binding NarL/FixJ family response regulator